MSRKRSVLKVLPSLPPSAFSSLFPNFCIQVSTSSLEELSTDARKYDDVVVYVRHPPTVKLLEKWLPRFMVGDSAEVGGERFYVVSAPQRPPVSGQDVPVDEKNVLVLKCVAAKGIWF
ncbi:MAG: hypothetical protein QW074_03335 [Candidatus Caldarchaeum sp.]